MIDVALVHFETITVPYLTYGTVLVVPDTFIFDFFTYRTYGYSNTLSVTNRGNHTDILIVLFFFNRRKKSLNFFDH